MPAPEAPPVQAAPPAEQEAPMALDVPDDGPEPAPSPRARVTNPGLDDDLPPPMSASALLAFASRRAGADAAPKPRKEAGQPAPKPASRPALVASSDAPPPARAGLPPLGPRPTLVGPAGDPAGKPLRGIGAMVTAPGVAGAKKPRAPGIPPEAKVQIRPDPSKLPPAGKLSQRQSNGLGSRPAAAGGKPKYLGLILTGLLLLVLVLVAAWSSFSLAAWQGADEPVQTVADPAAAPTPEDEMAADLQEPADPALLEAAPVEASTVVALAAAPLAAVIEPPETVAAAPEPLADAPAPGAVAPQPVAIAPEALAEAVEAAPPAPPPAEPPPAAGITAGAGAGLAPLDEPQDEIFLASADAAPRAAPSRPLPQTEANGDPPPGAQPPPPPFGTVYQFDENGLIRPTPEGIMTPEGVFLIAGPPPVLPPARPAAALPPPAPEAAAPVFADPALDGFRPRTRPEALRPPEPPSAEDDAALAAPADSRLAGLKPRAKPDAVRQAGAKAAVSAAAASLVAQADAAALRAAEPTAQAVAISRKPVGRPRDFTPPATLALLTPEAPAPEATQPDPAPEPQIGADSEPEPAGAAPAIPTRASVAKQATFKNAINLARINLIGVYGTQSGRYALIRQPNGQFKKVSVGDRIDGGRVAAITATEVRYQKGARLITLGLPKS